MTPREGFKYGFLLRCAEEGLTVKQAEARAAHGLEKRADFLGTLGSGLASGISNAITGTAANIPGWAMGAGGLGLAGAAVGGGSLGYGLAKMQEGDIDPQEVQREELIAAYRAQAELARRKAIMEAAQQARPRPRSHFGI